MGMSLASTLKLPLFFFLMGLKLPQLDGSRSNHHLNNSLITKKLARQNLAYPQKNNSVFTSQNDLIFHMLVTLKTVHKYFYIQNTVNHMEQLVFGCKWQV